MAHEEYIRIVPGAENAVLFIHGICGTPNHFRDLIPLVDLVPEDWSVYDLRLPGHGGDVNDFAHSSMDQWRKYAYDTFESLAKTHKRIVLVGHSMGTLFSIQLALKNPEKVPFLFLIAVPMRPWVRLFGMVNVTKLAFGKLREDIPVEAATIRVCGIHTTRKLWMYVKWIPRFLELFAEIHRTEKVMGSLTTPCVAYQSRKDELVSNFSKKVLVESGVMQVYELKDSTHFYYAPEDQKIVRQDFFHRVSAG